MEISREELAQLAAAWEAQLLQQREQWQREAHSQEQRQQESLLQAQKRQALQPQEQQWKESQPQENLTQRPEGAWQPEVSGEGLQKTFRTTQKVKRPPVKEEKSVEPMIAQSQKMVPASDEELEGVRKALEELQRQKEQLEADLKARIRM